MKKNKIKQGGLIKIRQLDYETGFIFIFNAQAKGDTWDPPIKAFRILDEEVMDGYLEELNASNKKSHKFLRGLNFSQLIDFEQLEKNETIGLVIEGPIKKIIPLAYWSMFPEKLTDPNQVIKLYKVLFNEKLYWIGSNSIDPLA